MKRYFPEILILCFAAAIFVSASKHPHRENLASRVQAAAASKLDALQAEAPHARVVIYAPRKLNLLDLSHFARIYSDKDQQGGRIGSAVFAAGDSFCVGIFPQPAFDQLEQFAADLTYRACR